MMRFDAEWQSCTTDGRAQANSVERDLDQQLDDHSLCGLMIKVHGKSITRLIDFQQQERQGPRVSGFALAEWLIWNWWRLRWEPSNPYGNSHSWRMSHELPSIGDGWIWPAVSFDSDGTVVSVKSQGTEATETEPVSYLAEDGQHVVHADEFEDCIETFVDELVTHMISTKLNNNPLPGIWDELNEERGNDKLATYRRLEALRGCNPDEESEQRLMQIVNDLTQIGRQTADELAAASALMPEIGYVPANELASMARNNGHDAIEERDSPMTDNAMAFLSSERENSLPDARSSGFNAARVLRRDERLPNCISDEILTNLCGLLAREILKSPQHNSPFTFLWTDETSNRIVFSQSDKNARRINAARLLGDKLLVRAEGALRPVTDTNMFRQKMQRSFAAELLCPSDALLDLLKGDFSSSSLNRAAGHFGVPVDYAERSLSRRDSDSIVSSQRNSSVANRN